MSVEPLRMNAYYYNFDETGVRSVDEILSAVATAGKAYHHTESWNEPVLGSLCTASYVDLIQQAADRVAAELLELRDVREELQARIAAWTEAQAKELNS